MEDIKDTRLRKKLFGEFSEDCLNLYTDPSWYTDKTRGFVGQTVDEVNKLKQDVKILFNTRDKLIDYVDNLQEQIDVLAKQLAKKTSKKRK